VLQRVNQTILLLPKAFSSGLLRSPKSTLMGHLNIVDALMRRDVRQAQILTQEHLGLTLKVLKDAIEGLKKIGMDPRKIAFTDVDLDIK
jgi:DNA-binding GntR family transcriptional regulator